MLWRVKDILPVIAPHLGGNGQNLACNPAAIQDALTAYNRINEIFMNRHDWPGTEIDVCLSAPNGCLTLPSRFETIKAISLDNRPTRILPAGWEYLESGPGIMDDGWPVEALQYIGNHFPTFQDLPFPMPVGIFSNQPEQERTTLRVQGLDINGRELIGPDGMTGWPLPILHGNANTRPAMTPAAVASITALSKPVTAGHIEVFAWHESTCQMHWLSRIEPRDLSPSYTRYRLTGPQCGGHNIRARVTLAYRELWDLEDVSLVQHREAYRLAAQAINAFDDNEGGLGSEFLNRALKMLKDRVAKLETGQRKGIHVNMSHRRPLRNPWNYTGR
jgi:hypothetical protein